MEIKIKLSQQVIIQAILTACLRRFFSKRLIILMALFLLLLCIEVCLKPPTAYSGYVVIGVFLGCVILCVFLLPFRIFCFLASRELKEFKLLNRGELEFEFRDQSVLKKGKSEFEMDYKNLEVIHETNSLLVLEWKQMSFSIIPKNQLPEETFNAIKNLIIMKFPRKPPIIKHLAFRAK